MSNFSVISWREQVTFIEMMIMSTLYKTNMLNWMFTVLAHWNNSPWIDMSLQSLPILLKESWVFRREVTNTNFLVFGLTRQSTTLEESRITITSLMGNYLYGGKYAVIFQKYLITPFLVIKNYFFRLKIWHYLCKICHLITSCHED